MTKAMAGVLAAGAFVVGLLVWPAATGLGAITLDAGANHMAMAHMTSVDCPTRGEMSSEMMSGSSTGMTMSMPCSTEAGNAGADSHHLSPSPEVTP